jgi:hypothetical protein
VVCEEEESNDAWIPIANSPVCVLRALSLWIPYLVLRHGQRRQLRGGRGRRHEIAHVRVRERGRSDLGRQRGRVLAGHAVRVRRRLGVGALDHRVVVVLVLVVVLVIVAALHAHKVRFGGADGLGAQRALGGALHFVDRDGIDHVGEVGHDLRERQETLLLDWGWHSKNTHKNSKRETDIQAAFKFDMTIISRIGE